MRRQLLGCGPVVRGIERSRELEVFNADLVVQHARVSGLNVMEKVISGTKGILWVAIRFGRGSVYSAHGT